MWCSLVSPPTSSMCRDRADWFADFLEEKCERRTNQTDQYAETKSVNVTEKRTLLLKDAIENCERFLRRCPVAGVTRKRALEVRELLLKVGVERRHVPNKVGLARLRLTRDQRGNRRNADAPTDVVQQILHEQRQNRDCGVKKRANQQHQDISDRKIAVLENAKIDNRMRRHQFAHDKRNEAGAGDDRAPHNHLRTEPIELLTFVEHDLQAREPNAEQPEAEVIDVRGGRTLQIRRILEKCAT